MTDRRERSLCFQNEFKPCVGTFQMREDASRGGYPEEQSTAMGSSDAGRPRGWEQGWETPQTALCLAWDEKKCRWGGTRTGFIHDRVSSPHLRSLLKTGRRSTGGVKGLQGAFVAHELPPSKVVIFKICTSFYKMPTVYEVSTVIWCLCTGHYLMSFKKLAFLKMVAGANIPCVSCNTSVSQESEPPFELNLGCLSLSGARTSSDSPRHAHCIVTSARSLLLFFSSTQGILPRESLGDHFCPSSSHWCWSGWECFPRKIWAENLTLWDGVQISLSHLWRKYGFHY